MKTKLFLFVFLLNCFCSLVKAQQTLEDSLQTAFFKAKEDTTARNLLVRLVSFYLQDFTKSPDERINHIQSLIQKKGDLNYLLGQYRVMLNPVRGDSIIEARKYLNEYLEQCKRLNDQRGYIAGLILLSQKESCTGNYGEALKLAHHSLEYASDTLKDKKWIYKAYQRLGVIHAEQWGFSGAMEYYRKAQELATESNNTDDLGDVCINIGAAYYSLGRNDSAEYYYRESIRLYRLSDNYVLANSFNLLAVLFSSKLMYDSAIVYAREAIKNASKNNNERYLANGYIELGWIFRNTGQPDSTTLYYKKAEELHIKKNYQFELRSLYSVVYDFYASVGKYQLAYEYLLKVKVIDDSLFNENNNKVLTEMDAKYQAGVKEQAILKQEEQIKRQRILTFSVTAIAVFFLLLIFFIYRSNRLKQKSNKLLAIAKEKAEQSEKFKQQFLANMSHEIRTPMNAVMGMTNLVLDTPLNPKQKKYLTGVKKASENLLHIINDILDISKIESGKFELEEIDFSIRDVVEQVKDILRNKAAEKNLQLITFVDSAVPEVLIGDPLRLTQVLMNLGGNAIKFTEKGSVQLAIGNKQLAKENINSDQLLIANCQLLFSVTDTGIGIPKGKLNSIFESFSQAHSSDSRKYGGTGLGLTISKQFIGLMGGELKVESVEGSGTTFLFELNMPVGSEENLLRQNLSDEIDGSILNGLKILLVDDNADNRIVCRDTLESKSNVIIEEATNGQEAVGLLSQKDFDVVLMDIQMPVMDGYEATRQIRSFQSSVRNHEIPVIALTASVIRSDLDKCREAGMTDYVPKPFKASQLILAISKLKGREIKFIKSKNPEQKKIANLKEGVTDLSYLREFCEDDELRIRKYISIFLESAPLLLEKLNTALTENNFEEVALQVHAFKTKFVMMGMDEVKDIAATLEIECRKETPEHETIYADTKKLVSLVKNASEELIYISNG